MQELILRARDVRQATPRTRVLTLDLGDTPFAFAAGQAVTAGLAHGQQRRPYSIACAPSQAIAAHALELLVQIDDHRLPDPHLEQVQPGSHVAIEGPFGSFALSPVTPGGDILLVAGGTGIAPLRSMLWDALDRGDAGRLTLLYSARTIHEFAYLDELERLAGERRIDLHLTVTRDAPDPWSGERGRIDRRLVQRALRTPDSVCAVCGPPSLVRDVIALLSEAGVAPDRIRWEASV